MVRTHDLEFVRRLMNCGKRLSKSMIPTEAITGGLFRDKDREDGAVVLASLHRYLALLDGKWLICLDNADETSANRIMEELASKARSCEG